MREKVSKNIPIKLILAMILLFFFSACTLVRADEKKPETHPVNFQFTSLGIPNKNASYLFLNYSTAYEKIKTGDFSKDDLNSGPYQSAIKQYPNPAGNQMVSVSYPDVYIGPGVTHNDFQTTGILIKLYQNDPGLLQALNENFTGTINTYQPPKNEYRPYQVDNKSKKFTTADGRVRAELPDGPTIIMNSNASGTGFVAFQNINNDSKSISVDTNNPSDLASIQLEGMDNSEKGANDTYVVGLDDEFSYKVTIKSDQLSMTSWVALTMPSNLLVSDTPDYWGDPILSPDQTTKTYRFPVAAQQNDLTFSFNAQIGQTIPPANFYNPNSTPPQYQIHLQVANDASTVDSVSPKITSSGINFAMVDGSTNKLTSGAQYYLGKKVDGKYYVYANDGSWQEQSDLSNIDSGNVMVLQGGERYIIGATSASPITANSAIISFDPNKVSKVNQSLIQIYGLAKGNDYFLKQLKPATGHALLTKAQPFSVSWSKELTPNDGGWYYRTSITNAKVQSVNINRQISDYATGYNEYNLLSVTQKNASTFNASAIKGTLFLIVFVVLIIGVTILLLVKKDNRKGR